MPFIIQKITEIMSALCTPVILI